MQRAVAEDNPHNFVSSPLVSGHLLDMFPDRARLSPSLGPDRRAVWLAYDFYEGECVLKMPSPSPGSLVGYSPANAPERWLRHAGFALSLQSTDLLLEDASRDAPRSFISRIVNADGVVLGQRAAGLGGQSGRSVLQPIPHSVGGWLLDCQPDETVAHAVDTGHIWCVCLPLGVVMYHAVVFQQGDCWCHCSSRAVAVRPAVGSRSKCRAEPQGA